MVQVKKRKKKSSVIELSDALFYFADLLDGQKEGEAAEDLRKGAEGLVNSPADDVEIFKIANNVLEAFSGEHELEAYMFERNQDDEKFIWGEADELYLASTKVFHLARRIKSAGTK